MLLGEILVRRGRITPEQLADTLEQQTAADPRRRLGEMLVEQGLVSEDDVLHALGEQFGAPVLRTVDPALLDPVLVAKLPVDWARAHAVLPVRTQAGLGLLTSDPTSMDAEADLSLILGCELTPMLATRKAILEAIERCYFQKQDSTQDFLEQMKSPAPPASLGASRLSTDLLRVSDDAPVTQLVNLILLEALKASASDIHIEPLDDRLRIRFRIDGLLYEKTAPPKHLEQALVSRLKVMAHMDIAEKRLPQDGMARVTVGEREIDVRASTVPVPGGERVVLRLLNQESALLPLTDLGMPTNILTQFQDLLNTQQGIVLITGPTGSGKTTTLYAALQELNTDHINVLTVEDPIEYQLPNIGQIQVKPKIGLTFAHGLRHILRQDPDVILVGETRDLDTAEIVIRASLTGHLVFTTLHTNDAAAAVVRLKDMGIEPYLLAASLRGCLAQRLIRRLCPECKNPVPLTDEEQRLLGTRATSLEGLTLYQSKGCAACLGGYKGRTGLYELMVVNDEIQSAVRSGADTHVLTELARQGGMRTLLDAGLDAVASGVTSVSEVLRCVGLSA